MKQNKKMQSGLFPISVLSTQKWWIKGNSPSSLTKGGAVATQQQCSSGTGACNNTCGNCGKGRK